MTNNAPDRPERVYLYQWNGPVYDHTDTFLMAKPYDGTRATLIYEYVPQSELDALRKELEEARAEIKARVALSRCRKN